MNLPKGHSQIQLAGFPLKASDLERLSMHSNVFPGETDVADLGTIRTTVLVLRLLFIMINLRIEVIHVHV